MELPGNRPFPRNHQDPDGIAPIAAIVKAIRQGQRFLVCSHAHPDGDAVGSVLATGMLLEQMGKRVDMVTADPIPVVYRGLCGADRIRTTTQAAGPYDAAILLECGSLKRTELEGLEKVLLINIDHHASATEFAPINWINHEAACVGEMIFSLYQAMEAKLTPEAASSIYTTVLTDTGGFTYGGTRAATFALARELILAGADPIRIAQQVFFSNPMSKLELLGRALRNLGRDGQVAWLSITAQDMLESGGREEDCEGIANYALSIAGVELAAFLREMPENWIRVSLRSKGKIDVAEIAERFGGGGHVNASGCTLPGPMARAREQVVGELRRASLLAMSSGANLIA